MRYKVSFLRIIVAIVLSHNTWSFAQDLRFDELIKQAKAEYLAGRLPEAERDFRELTKHFSSNVYMHTYLAQSLFEQRKFAESTQPYERARMLEKNGRKLSRDQHRILIDQLAMAYGLTGQLKRVHALLDEAVQQDPEYPLNYYNQACAFAEEGDKARMLANLSLAFRHKENVLRGEALPDPRSDSLFRSYAQDADFMALMKDLNR